MNIPAHIKPFWQTFVASRAEDPTPRFFEAFHFDDNQPSADELAQLVLAGIKRASAGLVWSFEQASMPLPKIGDLSVVTNWKKEPLCVIESQRIDIVAFDAVSADFAATEGEGDGSLEYWQRAHRAYFSRECQRIKRDFDPKMPVVCERFGVVFRAPYSTAA